MNTKAFFMKVCSSESIIIYGAHLVASSLYRYMCSKLDCFNLLGFAVSSMVGNEKYIEGIPVREINYYRANRQALILVATPEKYFSDIKNILVKLEFNNLFFVGEQGLAKLINPEMINILNKIAPELHAIQDPYEYGCIDIIDNNSMYRIVTLGNYPFNEKLLNIIKRNIKFKTRVSIEVYVACGVHQLNIKNIQFWEKILLVGSALQSPDRLAKKSNNVKNILFDNQGDNISQLNHEYAEMTATYFAWKNSVASYKGICHYRRRFIMNINVFEKINKNTVDVVRVIPRFFLPSVRDSFHKNTSLKYEDLSKLEHLISIIAPEIKKSFSSMLNGCVFYPNNMIIAKREIFDEYCEWIFDILEKIRASIPDSIRLLRPRFIAYTAELLTSLYFTEKEKFFRIMYLEYSLDKT